VTESDRAVRVVNVEALEGRRLFAHVVVIVPDVGETAMQAEQSPHARLQFGDGSVRFGKVSMQDFT
jgi:hypothetical protein